MHLAFYTKLFSSSDYEQSSKTPAITQLLVVHPLVAEYKKKPSHYPAKYGVVLPVPLPPPHAAPL